ncbi:hypothetical protein ACB030_19735 [Aeromonas sp. S16(2024)]
MNLTPERDNLGRIWCLFCVIKRSHKQQGRPRPPIVFQSICAGIKPAVGLSLNSELTPWSIRASGYSALQQLAAHKLPLIFEAGGGLELELGADVLVDPTFGISFATTGCA